MQLSESPHKGCSRPIMCACALSCFSCFRLLATLWTVACQAPLSLGSSRQEYWSGLPCPPPGDLPDPGTELEPPKSPALAGGVFTTEPPGKPLVHNSVQFSSVTQSCLTLCDPMDCSMPGLPVHHQLLEFTQTHVHESVTPSKYLSCPLLSPSLPAFNLS